MDQKLSKNIEKYNRLTIISEPFLKRCGKRRYSYIKCLCDCGNILEIMYKSVKANKTKSCGCLRKEITSQICIKRNTKHNLRYHPIYSLWLNIKHRCYNQKNEFYYCYGGKGIKLDKEWKNNFQTFYNWCIQNGWKEGLTIERKENNRNYCPENCTFITMNMQANNKTNNHLITVFGETKNLKQWSNDPRCKIQYANLVWRINNNWDHEKAIITPSRKIIC